MIVYSSLLHSITYGSSDESREDPGKPSSCFFAGKNMLICENWSLRLLLGESQRFMDAVVARDEENMTAPESQPYHMHSVSCYFGIQF